MKMKRTSAKEDMFLLLFVFLSTSNFAQKWICMKFSGKVGNVPMNKWLNFGGEPDHSRSDTAGREPRYESTSICR